MKNYINLKKIILSTLNSERFRLHLHAHVATVVVVSVLITQHSPGENLILLHLPTSTALKMIYRTRTKKIMNAHTQVDRTNFNIPLSNRTVFFIWLFIKKKVFTICTVHTYIEKKIENFPGGCGSAKIYKIFSKTFIYFYFAGYWIIYNLFVQPQIYSLS